MARTPAPAKVLSELAAPVEEATALLEEREAEPEAELEPEPVAELEPEAEPELALPVEVEVPVEVIVVIDPLEEMVEVIVEAIQIADQKTCSRSEGIANVLDVAPEVDGVELEKDAEEVEDEPASTTTNCPD